VVVPAKDTGIYEGDALIIYGRSEAVIELDRRRADASGERDIMRLKRNKNDRKMNRTARKGNSKKNVKQAQKIR
jgi:hypothetical protein